MGDGGQRSEVRGQRSERKACGGRVGTLATGGWRQNLELRSSLIGPLPLDGVAGDDSYDRFGGRQLLEGNLEDVLRQNGEVGELSGLDGAALVLRKLGVG